MREFIDEIKTALDQRLQEIDVASPNLVSKAEQSFFAVQEQLAALKAFILNYQFSGDQEEIRFFKEIKPELLSEQIFYAELYQVEANRPFSSDAAVKQYLERELDRLHIFFDRNQQLFLYLATGKTHQDYEYFMRKQGASPSLSESQYDFDSRFSTAQSNLVARIYAYQKLADYLRKALSGEASPQEVNRQKKKLVWTGQKVWFVELIYALHASGVFNNGQIELRYLFEFFETAFNIKVGNYYSIFLKNIRPRKKIVNVFLDMLTNFLLKRIDFLDEHPRY